MSRRTIALLAALPLFAAPAQAREEIKFAAAPLYVLSGIALLLGCVESEADGVDGAEEGARYARDGSYLGVGGSYALMDFRQDIFLEKERTRVPGSPPAFPITTVRKAHPIQADDSPGVNVRAGYRCHPRVGTEVQFDWLTGFDASFNSSFPTPDLGPGGVRGTIDMWQLAGNLKLYLLTGRIQPFISSGIGVTRARGGNLFAQRPDLGVDRVPPALRPMPEDPQLAQKLRTERSGPENLPEEATEFTIRLGAGVDIYLTENVVFSVDGLYADPGGQLSQLNHAIINFGFQYRF